MLAFLTKVHCKAKLLLKSSAFFSKSNTTLPSKKTGGIIDIFLLFKNLFIFLLFIIDQYVFQYDLSIHLIGSHIVKFLGFMWDENFNEKSNFSCISIKKNLRPVNC